MTPIQQTWHQWRCCMEARLAHLFRPELEYSGGATVYVVCDFDLPERFPGVGGFTNNRFSREFEQVIGTRFRGHGPGFFLNTADRGNPTAETLRLATATCLHEMGHWFQYPLAAGHYRQDLAPGVKIDTPAEVASDSLFIDYDAAERPGWSKANHLWDTIGCHGRDFLRSVVHTGRRAELAGWDFEIDRLAWWRLHGGGAIYERFALALRDEFRALHGRPLFAMHDGPEPDSYREFFDSIKPEIQRRFKNGLEDCLKMDIAKQALTAGTVPA